jgi:hypothetical protein
MECGTTLKWIEGLFCANFGGSLIGFSPCRSVQCPGCCSSSDEIQFHVATINSTGKKVENDEDRLRASWGKRLEKTKTSVSRPEKAIT